jgi:exosortase
LRFSLIQSILVAASLLNQARSSMSEIATQVSEDSAAAAALRETSANFARWTQVAALGVLIALLYHGILANLASQWWNDPDFSHGFFIPLFSGLVIWRMRRHLVSLSPAPSWSGLLIVVGALITLVVGVLGAELFLSRSSLILLLAGLVVFFLGWRVFRVTLFPWAFLFLMIPIPAILYNQLTFPLQLLASKFATGLLSLAGVPVLREGNVIRLPAMSLEVAEACSGIRSLIALASLGVVFAYFLESRLWKRIALVTATVPIAVAANGLRIMGTGLLVQYWDPNKGEGFFHEFSGLVIFVVSLGMLYIAQRLINFRWRRADGRTTS